MFYATQACCNVLCNPALFQCSMQPRPVVMFYATQASCNVLCNPALSQCSTQPGPVAICFIATSPLAMFIATSPFVMLYATQPCSNVVHIPALFQCYMQPSPVSTFYATGPCFLTCPLALSQEMMRTRNHVLSMLAE